MACSPGSKPPGPMAPAGSQSRTDAREIPTIWWGKPAGLACYWTDFRLGFNVILEKRPDPSRGASALDAL